MKWLALLLLLLPCPAWTAPAATAPSQGFAVDDRMRKNVQFWIDIYSKYDTTQALVHDSKYIDKVYEVVDLSDPEHRGSRYENAVKRKWRDLLMSVHKKQYHTETMTLEELKVYAMYGDVSEPNKFLAAAHRKRLRVQLGQRDRFIQGLYYSGRYLPAMEEVFKREGLPVELTRLPFVESSFNIKARSKVGASGIWQFMRSTGKLFLRIDDTVDERNDPMRATEAAAKLLKLNFDSLNNWPLAVTAYNHGRKGMMRAVRKVGSEELEDVVAGYRSRGFGFASTNFFTELLAAIEVEKNAEKYFGEVRRAPEIEFFEVKIPDYIDVRELATFLKLDRGAIRELNPGLADSVLEGKRLIPAGYQLRLPHDGRYPRDMAARIFFAGYTQIPDMYKFRGQKPTEYVRRRPRRSRSM